MLRAMLVGVVVVAASATAKTPTFVTTPSGRLQGFVDPTHKMSAFRGIPYAKPPIGDLRLRSPQPFGKWSGTRDATKFGHTCIQNSHGGWNTIEGRGDTSEECATATARASCYPQL